MQDDARGVYLDAQGSPLASPIMSRDHAQFYAADISRYGSDNAWLISRRDAQKVDNARLHLDQAFTLLTPMQSYNLPDDGRTRRLPGIGYCRLGPGRAMGGRVLDCLVEPGPSAMLVARLDGSSEGHSSPDYAPNFAGRHAQIDLFLDDKQLMAVRTSPTTLFATVTAYRAAAHFQRQLTAPSGALGGPAQTCPLPRVLTPPN